MAGPLDLRGRVTIVDGGATATLKRIGGAMSQVAAQSRAATTYLGNATKSVAHGGRTLAAPIGGMGGTGMVGFGAAAGSLGFLRTEMEYQQAMNRTQAVLNELNEKKFERHRDLVVDLAKRYPATSAEIAKGASELAMAGMSLEQVNAVLEATVQGSMASGESIKTVGMGVTDVVMGLGWDLTNSNFAKVNNVLAAAATSYAQDYTQFLAGFSKTAPMARVIGLDITKLAGMLGILADGLYKAEKGGTALRTSMINAVVPSKKALAFLNAAPYGININRFRQKLDTFRMSGKEGAAALSDYVASELEIDSDGLDLANVLEPILSNPDAFKNVEKLKRRLSTAISASLNANDPQSTKLIGEAVNSFIQSGFHSFDFEGFLRELHRTGFDKNEAGMKELFKTRFMAPMAMMINAMRKGQYDSKLNDLFLPRIEGAVERFAEILMKGLPGAVKRLGGAFDGLLRAMASSGAIDAIVGAIDRLRDGINWLSGVNPDLLKGLTLALVGFGVLAPVGMAISAIGGGLIMLGRGVRAVGGLLARIWALTRALTGLGQAAQTAGKIGWLFGAGAAGGLGGAAAGAAAGGAAVGGWKLGAKLGGKTLLRSLGFGGLVGMALYDAYHGYQKDGVKGAILNPLTLGLYSSGAEASEAPGGDAGAHALPTIDVDQQSDAALDAARRSAAEIEQTFANIDLSSAGRRMMETLAAGITAGGASAVAAASSVASQVRAAGERVHLNTGPAMSPAR